MVKTIPDWKDPMTAPLDIIVADRTPDDAKRLADRVRSLGHTVIGAAHDGDGLTDLLNGHEGAALLIGSQVGDDDGLTLAQHACEMRPLPFVLLGDEVDEATTERLANLPAALFAREDASVGELRAALLIANATFQRWEQLRQEAESLEERLRHRTVISKAKGRIMEERGVGEERAYATIRTVSQNRRIPMAEVAREILEHGVEPSLGTDRAEHGRRH